MRISFAISLTRVGTNKAVTLYKLNKVPVMNSDQDQVVHTSDPELNSRSK